MSKELKFSIFDAEKVFEKMGYDARELDPRRLKDVAHLGNLAIEHTSRTGSNAFSIIGGKDLFESTTRWPSGVTASIDSMISANGGSKFERAMSMVLESEKNLDAYKTAPVKLYVNDVFADKRPVNLSNDVRSSEATAANPRITHRPDNEIGVYMEQGPRPTSAQVGKYLKIADSVGAKTLEIRRGEGSVTLHKDDQGRGLSFNKSADTWRVGEGYAHTLNMDAVEKAVDKANGAAISKTGFER